MTGMAEVTRDGTIIGMVRYKLVIDESRLVTGRVWDVAWRGYPQPRLAMDFLRKTPRDSKLTMRVKGGRRVAFLVSSTKGEIFNGAVVDES